MFDIALGVVLVALGSSLGAFAAGVESLREGLRRAVAIVLVAMGVAFVFGIVTIKSTKPSEGMVWRSDVEMAVAEARSRGMPMVLDATAK